MTKEKLTLAKVHDFCGEAEPKLTAVCIHGVASDSHTFDKALDFFKNEESLKSVRFVAFDLLGSGESVSDDSLNYDYTEQIEALHNSISELELKTPLVLMGHSMGTLVAERYADMYKGKVDKLLLLSPPVYTLEDIAHPTFKAGMEAFEKSVSAKNPEFLEKKSFRNMMKNVVLDKTNYRVLAELKTPAILIYGDEDVFIGAQNIPELVKNNDCLIAVKTHGRHGVTKDKYEEAAKELEKILHA